MQFSYDPQGRPDAWKRYVDEARNDLRSRISHITTYVGSNLDGDVVGSGTVARDYALQYEQSPTSGRTLLNSVQACGRNPQTLQMDCLPATNFTWGKPDPNKTPGFESKGMWAGAPDLNTWNQANLAGAIHPDYFAFADFENHGHTDALEKSVASLFSSSSGDDVGNPIPVGTPKTSYRYFHNNGNGFTQYTYQLDTGEPFIVLSIGDFNGDGAPDLLVTTPGNVIKICLSPLGKPGGLGALGTPILFTCDPNRPTTGIKINSPPALPYVIDIVGDGRAAVYGRVVQNTTTAPLCIQQQCMTDINAPLTVLTYPYLDTGSSDINAQRYVSFNQMVDFTGTGKTNDVRWTQPFYQDKWITQEGQSMHIQQWMNLTPQIIVTSFHVPGSAPGTDGLAAFTYPGYSAPASTTQWPYSFDEPNPDADLAADFNGSGYNSLLFGFLEYGYNPGSNERLYNRAETTLCLSTGRALDCSVRKKFSGAGYQAIRAVGNFVGDGTPGILVETMNYQPGLAPKPSGNLQMCRLLGDDTTGDANDTHMVCQPWGGVNLPAPNVFPNLGNQAYFMDLLGTGRNQLVLYHSGTVDSARNYHADGRWEVFAPIDVAVTGQALDRIHQVTNGLGSTSTVEYTDGLPSGVVSQSGSSNLGDPLHLTGGVGKLVSRLRTGNGVSAERTVSYRYQDAAIDRTGRGSLGFGIVSSSDEQTGVVTTTRYRQDFPFTGMVSSSTTTYANQAVDSTTANAVIGTVLDSTTNILDVIAGFPYIRQSTSVHKDLDGSDLGTSTTVNQYTDGWGNLTQQTITVVGGGQTYTSTTATTFTNDSTLWLIGRPILTAVNKSDTVSGSLTRTTGFTNDPATGLRLTQTVEPNDATLALRMTTTFGRDSFGNVNRTTQSWQDPASNSAVSRIVSDITFEPNGRFPQLVKNATCFTTTGVCQSETRSYDPASGTQTGLIGPNGLPTTWTVDGFGRVLTELHADQTQTNSYRKQCGSSCPNINGNIPASVSIADNVLGGDRITVPTLVYTDSAGHVLRTQSWGYSGQDGVSNAASDVIVTDQRYDTLGRPFEADQPRFINDGAVLASRTLYDPLSRVTDVMTIDDQSVGTNALLITHTDYHGLSKIVTNPRQQQKTDQVSVIGQLVQSTDAIGGVTLFGYDPFGNLSKTTDPKGNVVIINYDLLGRKTQLQDPDLGIVRYTVNPRGLLIKQQSANDCANDCATGRATVFRYDMLDRMIARLEPNLESHWVFDQQPGVSSCAASASCGQLIEAYTQLTAGKDYDRVHSYDSLGRPSSTVIQLDVPYTSNIQHDAYGRVVTISNQRGSSPAKVFGQRYTPYGYLAQMVRTDSIGTQVLWQATQHDAAARVTQAIQGNGLQIDRSYSPQTGRLREGKLTNAQTHAQQLLESYFYDALGNVSTRNQTWNNNNQPGFAENFSYDGLNRLSTSQVVGQGVQTFTYDGIGNLTSKTGVGSYAYPVPGAGVVRPHAVTGIASTGDGINTSFNYDANGNLLNGAGRSLTWTSFDMPLTITKGSESSRFAYGPEHQRTKQIKSGSVNSTIYYAGAMEVETTTTNATTVKTYWPTGLGVEIDKPSAASDLEWTHTDRLGSIIAISGASGTLSEQLEYDAWGKRRTLIGDATPDTLDGQVDNKGFTGHEMLDQLDLVHMNGRVYDPLVARFMSADPLIQDPTHSQSYNRYTYVWNNPTNLTDPTGFGCETPTGSNLCARTEEAFNTLVSMVNVVGAAFRGEKSERATTPAKTNAQGNTQVEVKALTPASGGTPDSPSSGSPSGAAVSGGASACGQCNRGGQNGLANLFERLNNLVHGEGFTSNAENAAWGAGFKAAQAQGTDAVNAYLRNNPLPSNATAAVIGTAGAGAVTGVFSGAATATATATTTLAEDLGSAAQRAAQTVGPGRGPVYGTRVHSAFENEVNALGKDNVHTEVSYLNGQVVPYGTKGSVRLDVVNGPVNAPISVYDLKTGSAALTPARIQQIQSNIPGGSSVPVIEIRP
ncbi:RHS repeat-associated core domain-containing protein [Undibacterium sp.]|uniref:RHS repeat-associated core domain-containing protein n=1 Tax=Undibacterium sp. TaxID=1914977 RepID=UPI002C8F6F6B|nr:RHS repeat-associated core domain-containing protein [Undibacterium sp.]HTD06251.1 RHS repeat-associated core domain-containing protein [Undibacterium sp.]